MYVIVRMLYNMFCVYCLYNYIHNFEVRSLFSTSHLKNMFHFRDGIVASDGYFGYGYGPIWVDDIDCNDDTWDGCTYQSEYSDCSHYEDIAIICGTIT